MEIEFEKVDFREEPNCMKMQAWVVFGFLERGFDYGWRVHTYENGKETRDCNPMYEGDSLNFDWVLEATAENRDRIMAEIRKRAAQF